MVWIPQNADPIVMDWFGSYFGKQKWKVSSKTKSKNEARDLYDLINENGEKETMVW